MGSGYPAQLAALHLDVQRDLLFHRYQGEEGSRMLQRMDVDDADDGSAPSSAAQRAVTVAVADAFAKSRPSAALAHTWQQMHRTGARTAARWADLLNHVSAETLMAWDGMAILTDRFVVRAELVRLAEAVQGFETWLASFLGKGLVNGRAKHDCALTYATMLGRPGFLLVIGTDADGNPVCEPFTGTLGMGPSARAA